MDVILHLVLALLLGAGGCWLSARVLPPGAPQVVGQVLSVLLGFGAFAGRWLL